ncbi:sensor domain-containing protein [Actinomarinicola tropica]|uniref:EAL domain-containing protein n=1 Tax=Actinomarinicola tropica TaxID=2789776 RepID=A0A5Q2RMA4_9ACTN|nr:EAL domain-containing protein [Actinomarinicola tropica]QGG96604.1 EAL domain-containing protein [Actinomarinicola tropica]
MARSSRRNEPVLPFPPSVADVDPLPPASLLAHVSDLVAVVDAKGEIRAVSGSVERRLGHRPDRLIGAPVATLFVADHAEVPPEVLDRVFLARGTHGPITLLALDADGRPRPVEAMIENRLEWDTERSADPTSGSVVVTAVDLTERRMIDAALTEQRSVLEAIARGAAVDDTAARLVERLGRWIPDAASAVLLLEPDGRWRIAAESNVPSPLYQALDHSDAASPVGKAIARLPDRTTAVTLGEPSWFAIRAACRTTGVESFWVRPFRVTGDERPCGALFVIRNDRRVPTDAESDLVEQSAHLAAIAVERQSAVLALEHAAVHDELTGLPNRALLVDRIEQAIGRAQRTGSRVGVLFVDIDRFKHVNDTLGHATGDAVLCAVADRLHETLRAGDAVGRLNGDEFLMVCSDVDSAAGILTVAQRVVESFAEPIRAGAAEMRVRVSIGVAVTEDADARAEDVVRNAEHAMIRAKERGRDGIVLYEEADHRRALSRVDIEQSLHGAHERGEIVLHYQPVIRLADRRQVGVEALVRWERPGLGLVHPADFIAVAEESGLIIPLGAWILEEAFRSAAAWPLPLRGGRIQVAINLSARQLSAPGLLDRVHGLLERTGVPPDAICFEVTESALVGNEELAVETLERLKALGAHIAIDDFGTGHATLDYLRRFSMADTLKIDRSFVQGLDSPSGQERAIVGASVALAHSLGIGVVAEGIETEAQLRAVVELGCDHAQGYLLGPPERFVQAASSSTER